MTDFVWTIGTGDQMMIRDTGTNVEFWFHSDTSTFNHQQPFAYTINGHTVSSTFDLPADGAWHRVGYENVTTDQTVSFTIYDEGLGWPTTTHTATIDRASPPASPKPPILTVRGSTVIELDLGADGANNGAAIDLRQYSGSSSSAGVGNSTRTASNNYQWTGLAPGTKYYFWERTHNAKGYSGWSAAASATTWNVPAAPATPSVGAVTNTTVDLLFTDGANNGQAIDARQFGYGTDPNTPQYTADVPSGWSTLGSLTPGLTYYFWARAHNSIGWGPYGGRTTVLLKRQPDPPSSPVISEITQTSVRAVFSDNGDGGADIVSHQLGWGTSATAPTSQVNSSFDQTLTGLPAGTQLYFFARSYNMYGWSAWSAAKAARTVAGAWIFDLTTNTWKRAIPWVNVNGVWKTGKPWAKIAGVWKGTTS